MLVISIITNAQVEVGVRNADNSKKELGQTQLIQLRNSTINFIVPSGLESDIKVALEKYWSFSDWTITSEMNLSASPDKSNCIFTLNVAEGPNVQCPEISLILYMADFAGNKVQVGRIMLQPTGDLILGIQSLNSTEEKCAAIFKNGAFYNAGEYLANNLRAMNNLLASGGSIWLDQEKCSVPHVTMLETNELYIPEYCLLKRNMISGQDEIQESSKLLKKYTWPVSLDKKDNQRFICMYAQAGAAVYMSIFDNISGNVIYHHKSMNQYKLSSKDFKALQSSLK